MKNLKQKIILGGFALANLTLINELDAQTRICQEYGIFQETNEEYSAYCYNNLDSDDFLEEKNAMRQEGFNPKSKGYPWVDEVGMTVIKYEDKDNDGFYETISEFNCDQLTRIIVENFYIDKNTGLIDYTIEKVKIDRTEWRKYYGGNNHYLDYLSKNNHRKIEGLESTYMPNLTQKYFAENPEFGARIKRLVNAGKSGVALENFLKSERYFWKNK